MADTFPQTHTTSTRTTVINNKPSADVRAITTASGILKVVEIVSLNSWFNISFQCLFYS